MEKTKNPRIYLIDGNSLNDDIRSLVNDREYIGLTIHNSAWKPEKHQVFDMDKWHYDRFSEKGLGYSFVVEKDGTIYASGRMVKNQKFAHCKGKVKKGSKWVDINKYYIGICFSGHGVLQELTMCQRASGYALIHHLAKYSDIDRHGIHTHAVLQGDKVCPGYLFEKWVGHFVDAITEGVNMR